MTGLILTCLILTSLILTSLSSLPCFWLLLLVYFL